MITIYQQAENSMTYMVFSHQYSLSQQVLETYPIFYLSNLLLLLASPDISRYR